MGLADIQRQFAARLVIMADRRAGQVAQGYPLTIKPCGQLGGVGRGQMAREAPAMASALESIRWT
jgi:hypothetical protein